MLYNLIIAIHIIVSMVLILVILMQAGRGSGVNEMFGGSQTQTIFGTSASNFLMKATAVSAVVFIITCMTLLPIVSLVALVAGFLFGAFIGGHVRRHYMF